MKLSYEFYHRPCVEVARDLVGKVLVHHTENGELRLRISETEAYCGEGDTACHASKGRTKRTEVMYMDAGTIYIYLCYGMHWMLNIVTGEPGEPEAVLIRACREKNGPGKLTKAMHITGELNRCSILATPSGSRTTACAAGSKPTNGWASATPARPIRTGSGASKGKTQNNAGPAEAGPAAVFYAGIRSCDPR